MNFYFYNFRINIKKSLILYKTHIIYIKFILDNKI